MMVRSIFCNYWPQSTGTQAVNMLNGKLSVCSYFAWLYAQVAGSLVKKKISASYVTGCTCAEGKDILAGRLQPKGLIKRSNPVDFNKRYAKILGDSPHIILGNVTKSPLDVLKYFNKLIRLAATSF